uniref:G-protein coupled receptors family 1 profile domain-containing protein n=1 Tax=Biomphalaria glabrata TaxID=6526 RepID=A0A2C9LGU3_BIOGL
MNSIRNSIHNWNVLQLAVCDLLSCVFVLLPFHLELYDISLLTHFRLCRVMRYLHYSFGLESSFLVIIISFDRLLMVLFGKKYRKICTKSVSKFMTFLSWCTVAAMVTPLVVVDVRHGRVMEQNNYSCPHFTGDRQDALKYTYVRLFVFKSFRISSAAADCTILASSSEYSMPYSAESFFELNKDMEKILLVLDVFLTEYSEV